MECFPSSTPEWLKILLMNPKTTDLCINGTQGSFVDQGEGLQPCTITEGFSKEQLHNWVLELLAQVGKSWNAQYPFVDASLPSGYRLHVTFAPISPQGILISLRRLPALFEKTNSVCKQGPLRWQPSHFYQILCQAVQEGHSILISGATGSGKTTLANDLLEEVPAQERIIALEDTAELAPQHPHFLSLISRVANSDGFGEITLRTLLRQTLRMRPDRIVLGECRGPEVLDLLQALNTGHRGTLTTLHANSPREALRRIELLCLLSQQNDFPLIAIRELLSLGIQWIIQVKKIGFQRSITDICQIQGREGDMILLRSMVESSI